jgi:hypothetical protein
MTFTIRGRGGDAPTATFLCDDHGYFDARTRDDAAPCPECAAPAPWALDRAPIGRTPIVTAGSGGRSDPRPHPGVMDTRSMGEGQSYRGWKRDRAAYWEGVRQREIREIKR